MTLPVPQLDDRRFQDLVDEAKRRIPRHFPEWTNHNVSDPGVALIELFAWMTEMTLYRLDHMPDRAVTTLLNIIGISPRPAQPAATRLTFWLKDVPDVDRVVVPEGTEVAAAIDSAQVVFRTDREAIIRPTTLDTVFVADEDGVWEDLTDDLDNPRTALPCFRGLANARDEWRASRAATSGRWEPRERFAGDAIAFGFDASLADLVIRLEIDAAIAGRGINPMKPPWVWEVSTSAGWEPVEVVSDGTDGLNSSGPIDLQIGPRHDPLELANPRRRSRRHWLRLRVRTNPDTPMYDQSPELNTLRAKAVGITIPAHHAHAQPARSLGTSDGRPEQRFSLGDAPILPRQAGETIEVDGEPWSEIPTFAHATEVDRVFTWDSTTGDVCFGPSIVQPDGTARQYGAVPPAGATIAATGYRVGGGSAGNVGPYEVRHARSPLGLIGRVENRIPASGGVDAESVEQTKMRAPESLRAGDRVVTLADYDRHTRIAVPEIAAVRSIPSATDAGSVAVLVVPTPASRPGHRELDDFALGADTLSRIEAHIAERQLVGQRCIIGTPRYQGLSVVCRVRAHHEADAAILAERATTWLYERLDPVEGEWPEGPFGTAVDSESLRTGLASLADVVDVSDVALFGVDLRADNRRIGAGATRITLAEDEVVFPVRHRVVVEQDSP